MIRAVLFDLDGVLADAADCHFEALNLALEEVSGISVFPEERDVYEGMSTRQKLVRIVEHGRLPPGTEEAVYRLKQAHTVRLVEERIEPDPVKMMTCRMLRGDGQKLACVSNCIRASVDALLRLSDLARFMDVTVSNEDVEHPKPAPDPYLLACRLLSVTPSEALAVEDHERGVQSAIAAGCHHVQLEYQGVNYFRVKKAIDGLTKPRRFVI